MGTPSIAPNTTFPMVAMRLAKDLPQNLAVVGSFTFAIIVFLKGGSNFALHAVITALFGTGSVMGNSMVQALLNSRPDPNRRD